MRRISFSSAYPTLEKRQSAAPLRRRIEPTTIKEYLKTKNQPYGWCFLFLVAGAGLEPTTFGL